LKFFISLLSLLLLAHPLASSSTLALNLVDVLTELLLSKLLVLAISIFCSENFDINSMMATITNIVFKKLFGLNDAKQALLLAMLQVYRQLQDRWQMQLRLSPHSSSFLPFFSVDTSAALLMIGSNKFVNPSRFFVDRLITP